MNINEYPPEIRAIARARTNQAIIEAQQAQKINGSYNPEWGQRKTATGRNYNGGKYDTPYAEDNVGKAVVMGFFLALFAAIFFWV